MKNLPAVIALFLGAANTEMVDIQPMWQYFGESCEKADYDSGAFEPASCTNQERYNSECCNFKIINKSGGVEIDTHFCVDNEQREYDGVKTYSGRYRDFDYSLWEW